MYVDGASGKNGSGAGIPLISPEGREFTYRLRFAFPTTNNEVEYEALISGFRLACELKVPALRVYSDSQIIIGQMIGTYEARTDRMKKYLEKAKSLQNLFRYCKLSKIPRSENSRADALSKLALTSLSREEEVIHRSIDEAEVHVIQDEPNWMTPIRSYLELGELPEDKTEARKMLHRAQQYTLMDGILYKKSYLQPLLRCAGPSEANYMLREMHEGSCGSHIGARALSKKVMLHGYHWPTLLQDASDIIKTCTKC